MDRDGFFRGEKRLRRVLGGPVEREEGRAYGGIGNL